MSSDAADTEGDFCGVLIKLIKDGVVSISCPKLLADLEEQLKDHPLFPGMTMAYPMAHEGPNKIMEPVSEKNPLMSELIKAIARSILGRGGFICANVRPDAYFAYVCLCQCVGTRFTLNVWKELLRWAHYLVHTKELELTYRAGDEVRWSMHSDSSLANAKDGGSWGGYAFSLDDTTEGPTRGLFDWKCMSPRAFTDSSAASELVCSTLALKSILAHRMLLNELHLLKDGPTLLYLDANAVINGAEMERVTRQMRFMAARYSMLRQAVTDKRVKLAKVHTDYNKADIFTKALTGEAFIRGRALVMGLPYQKPTGSDEQELT